MKFFRSRLPNREVMRWLWLFTFVRPNSHSQNPRNPLDQLAQWLGVMITNGLNSSALIASVMLSPTLERRFGTRCGSFAEAPVGIQIRPSSTTSTRDRRSSDTRTPPVMMEHARPIWIEVQGRSTGMPGADQRLYR